MALKKKEKIKIIGYSDLMALLGIFLNLEIPYKINMKHSVVYVRDILSGLRT